MRTCKFASESHWSLKPKLFWQEKNVFDIIQLVNTQNGTLTWMVVPDAQFTQEPFLPGTPEELMSTGQFNTGCSRSEKIPL